MKLRTIAHGLIVPLFAMAMLLSPPGAHAKTDDKAKQEQEQAGQGQKEGKDESSLERVPNNVYESLKNRASRVEFYSTNYGVFTLNPGGNSSAGGFWPRGSNKGYMFGGGLWFAALKNVRTESGNDTVSKLCAIGYNPNSGAGWFVPGRITQPYQNSKVDQSPEGIKKYRMYFSTDYNGTTGEPYDQRDRTGGGPNWPVWDTSLLDSLRTNRYFGYYVDSVGMRNTATFKKGPAIISGEDIFSIYKDTDLSRYEQGRSKALAEGYPLGLQIEQTIYSWGFGLYADFFFLRYSVINTSADTLRNCYVAPAMDMDIGSPSNDHSSIVIADKRRDTLNLAAQWSDYTQGDGAKGPWAYIGADFLESPAVWRAGDVVDTVNGVARRVGDSIGENNGQVVRLYVDSLGNIRRDKRVFDVKEQIGLTTFRSWLISEDPKKSYERYDFLSSGRRDQDPGPGDKRFLMATGPFNMRPGDTARTVIGVMFAYGLNPNQAPTGTTADMRNLIAIDTFAQRVYDDNFSAPTPPDPANVTWRPLNNAVELAWDTRSELSFDKLERGLDFKGYRIQRYRRALSTVDSTDTNKTWDLYPKTIATFSLPSIPDSATRYKAAHLGDLSVLGPWYRLPMLADTGNPGMVTVVTRNYDTVRTYMDSIFVKPDGTRDTVKVLKNKTTVRTFDTTVVFNFERLSDGYAFDPYNDVDTATHYGGEFAGKTNATIVRDAILSIMDSITSHRRLVDVGDDNHDGRVSENSEDLSKNERLLNNVDYYYRVLAYDEGSKQENTPSKINSAIAGINEVRATPEAPPAGTGVNPTIVGSGGLGGIFNFRFEPIDPERLAQLFGGDTIHFEFNPASLRKLDTNFVDYYYLTGITARSKRTGAELLRFYVPYGFKFSDRADTTNNAGILASFLGGEIALPFQSHQTDTGFYNARMVRSPLTASYTPDASRPEINSESVNSVGIYNNTFSVGFDYQFVQYGDSLRFGRYGDETGSPFTKTSGSSDVNLVAQKQFVGRLLTQQTLTQPNQLPSLGQAKIEVEFHDGGVDPQITFNKRGKDYTFRDVPYLTMTVRNVASYQREVIGSNGETQTSDIRYNYEFPANPDAQRVADTTTNPNTSPYEYVLDPAKYALYSYGWLDVEKLTYDNRKFAGIRSTNSVGRVGQANRYYLTYRGDGSRITGTDNGGESHTLSFTNKLIVNGAEVSIDAAGMGIPEASFAGVTLADVVPQNLPTQEFKPGDKFTVDFTGGAIGLPQPGAYVDVAIPSANPALDSYTDDMLNQISIVPNPYLIDHVGQQSTVDRLLYITRLPQECTIQVYTEAGELVQTIEHKAGEKDGRIAVNAWDLLTKANRQVQSQLLIFRITTPNGAETIKKCAVIVGGFRVIGR